MGLFNRIFTNFIHKNTRNEHDARSEYIFYKIVDSIGNENKEYVLQCINTSATFYIKISDIVFDIDILYGLHPIQACYVGIEYAKLLKKENNTPTLRNSQVQKLNTVQICRYGNYQIRYQDRDGNIFFINRKTFQDFIMDPCDIALNEKLIQEFDAAQAFYIGLLAGLKMNNPTAKHIDSKNNKSKYPPLRIIQ